MKESLTFELLLRETHEKYSSKTSDEQLQQWLICLQSRILRDEKIQRCTETNIKHLREYYEEAMKSNAVENAQKIQEWFKQQRFLPPPSLGLIHKFLWASKNDFELCKKNMMNFYSLRGADEEIFNERDPCSAESKKLNEYSTFVCLPGYTPELYRITVSTLKNLSPDVFWPKDWLKRLLNVADLRVRGDFSLGEILIFDLNGFSMQHLLKFHVTLAKKLVVATEGALPTRIKQIHMINCPTFVDKILALFRPFLKEKIAKRIIVNNTLNDLYKYIPKDMLPNEYGGKAGPLEKFCALWDEEFEDYRQWFIIEEKSIKRIYNELKKNGKIFTDCGQLFGVEGSFKQLSID